jgi:shikimate kinase
MKSIYLIGFMGAGKTSVAKKLAGRLSVENYDTDREIEQVTGKSIKDIFTAEGEAKFREVEAGILKKMPVEEAVIATGGGVILAEGNRFHMKQNGTVIFLSASMDEILNRLSGDDSRPLLKDKKQQTAEELYSKRLPLYREAAHFEIDTNSKSISEIVDEIVERLKK